MLLLFPPLSGCDQPRPKGQPTPPAGVSSKQILNGKESLSCTFPAGGLPSNMPQHDAAHDQGRRVAPSMRRQIGRARLAEKMGGSGTGKRKPPHKGAGKTTEQAFFAALHFWRGNMCLCAPGSILLTWDDPLPGHPRRRSLGSISAEQIAQCILSRSGRTCPCCQGADLQRGLWLDAGGLPPLPDHVGR